MKCPECGYNNPKNKQFCQKCLFNVVLDKRVRAGYIVGSKAHMKAPVAYFKDKKTGEMIPVDKKGKRISNDPYYKSGDYRGWKRAGKKTDGYHKSVHFRGWKKGKKK